MASGLSGGLIANLLEENGGASFTTIDHDNTFFGDPTKENGFLIEEIYSGSRISIEKIPFSTSLDLGTVNKSFDMAFIDANHQHPWPLLDTLCLHPFLKGSKIVIHHDLNLYKLQEVVYGIGPKHLFDQFPEAKKSADTYSGGNIFSLDLEMQSPALEEIAINAFHIPWSLRTALTKSQLETLEVFFSEKYSDRLLQAFLESANRFNKPFKTFEESPTSSHEPPSKAGFFSSLLGMTRRE